MIGSFSTDLNIPSDWIRLHTIDMHTGGEPLRILIEPIPGLQAGSILAYRKRLQNEFDWIRQLLMNEPRGHADMYGCVIVPPNDEGADFGVVFMHNAGYSTMCGHATLAVSKLAVELGWVQRQEPVTTLTIDAPCGRLQSQVDFKLGTPSEISFTGVPAYVQCLDQTIELAGHGPVKYDLAYGGAFYAYVNAPDLGLTLHPSEYAKIIAYGRQIKAAIGQSGIAVSHPFESDLSFLYGVIFVGPSSVAGVHSKNVCVFADGEVDRSPTGSGVSGRMAIHAAKGELDLHESVVIESIIGSQFTCNYIEKIAFGPYEAVIPQVSGSAYITGQHVFMLDPNDELGYGFLLR